MSDDAKANANHPAEEKSEELNPNEQEQVSGGAFDQYLNINGIKGDSTDDHPPAHP
jgi:hypothetical protein